MRTSFINTLLDIAAHDERVWLLTADLGFSVLEPFIERFPDRYLNVGIAEQNMVGVAAGLAEAGLKPFLYSIANFPTMRCLEQIRNDICYHDRDVTIVAVGGGLAYATQGYTHHGVEDLAVMRSLPGMTVMAPGDPVETKLATEALAYSHGPAYLRLGKANEPVLHEINPPFLIGRGILMRPGFDGTLVSTGAMLGECLTARDRAFAERGLEIRVVSMPTVKPLDERIIAKCAQETPWIMTVEEHSITGGLGAAVAEVMAENPGRARLIRHGLPDRVNYEFGSQTYLRERLMGNLYERIAGQVGAVRRAA